MASTPTLDLIFFVAYVQLQESHRATLLGLLITELRFQRVSQSCTEAKPNCTIRACLLYIARGFRFTLFSIMEHSKSLLRRSTRSLELNYNARRLTGEGA